MSHLNRIAIVGTGRMSAIHFKNINNHPKAKCTHIVSNSLSRAEEFLNNHHLGGSSSTQTSSNLQSLLQNNNDDIDGIIIASASNQHYEQIKQSLSFNKPVFTEKPIANSLKEIDQLYEIQQKNNLPPIMVGYQRRFDPNIQKLYKDIHINEVLIPPKNSKLSDDLIPIIGGIEKIISTSRDPTYPNIDYAQSNVNGFYDSIIHDIDTICYISRQYPNKVYAAGHAFFNPIANINDYDRVFITLHFESGLLGLIDWCRHSGYSYDQRLNILGYGGMLEMNNEKDDLLIRYNNTGVNVGKPVNYFLERYSKAYKNEIDEFIQVIQGTKKVSTTHQDVRNVNIIVESALQSVQSGEPVNIYYDETYQNTEGMML